MNGRSTVTQLLQVLHDIQKYVIKEEQVPMVYLDFEKAFDKNSSHLTSYLSAVMEIC